MNEKDLQNIILIGLAGFAVYYFLLRKSPVPVGGPLQIPGPITVTPRVTTSQPSPQEDTLAYD